MNIRYDKTALLAVVGAASISSTAPAIAKIHVDPVEARVEHVKLFFAGKGSIALGQDSLKALIDTLRATTPLNITANVTTGDLHIVSENGDTLRVYATVTGSGATRMEARGRHLVVERAGRGITSK